ncbi:MAG: DNA polymerase ligase N-terminal domain-containing protein, partial [Chloroflexota bacterium]
HGSRGPGWTGLEQSEPLRFVLQKHAARRLHYDLRMEVDGVLKSWAIPRGPSANPKERRLAISVEEYPLECASFEGVIPEGEYGSGEVIVWDAGVYSPDDDHSFFFGARPEAEERVRRGLDAGKISLFFWGYKLAGSWSLVRIEGSPREWLFVKHDDLFAEPARNLADECRSILSGRTIEELREELAASHLRRKRA